MNGFLGIGLFLLLLALGGITHWFNMKRYYRLVAHTTKAGDVSLEELKRKMFIQQGSRFNAAAVTSWILLLLALAYFFFLTPDIFPRLNYFQIPSLASGPLGFAIFGIFILAFSLSVAVFVPKELYGYYDISKRIKVAIMLTVPLLAVSIILSIQQGTIFPQVDMASRYLAFILIIGSEAMLLSPVYIGPWKG